MSRLWTGLQVEGEGIQYRASRPREVSANMAMT